MPVETLQSPLRPPVRTVVASTFPRLRPKGPVGPDSYRQCPAAAGRPKQSAVERLEADKAKYVKSQVALSKQQPVRRPEMRRPLLTPNTSLRPTRRTPTKPKTQQDGVPFDLEHLSKLINGVNDGPLSAMTVSSEESHNPDSITTTHSSPCPITAGAEQKEARTPPPHCPDWSTPPKVRLQSSGLANAESRGPAGSPAAVTVRRVDVMPQARPVRMPCRPQQYFRQPLRPMPLHSQFQIRPATSNLHLFHPRTAPDPAPLKPVLAPSKPDHPPSSPAKAPVPVLPTPSLPVFPPASPAITRLSSSSSRKRPSLTRSKSDMSDRYSRAGTELERFFNLCGVDPSEVQELAGPGSDIVSMTRFRSASVPGSECAGSGREDEDEEEDGNVAQRVPYGVSVIERNARVIKWLYGLRQDKDNARSTDL
ncbi:protein FAM110A [Diretmus argenteus]